MIVRELQRFLFSDFTQSMHQVRLLGTAECVSSVLCAPDNTVMCAAFYTVLADFILAHSVG